MNLSNATVGQLMLPVDDLDRAAAFYRDVLGLPFLFTAPPQMAFFLCGGGVYFKVDDIRGVAEPHVVHRAPEYELWIAEFFDPDGNRLALMSEVRA